MQASSAASEHCKQSGSKKWNHHQILYPVPLQGTSANLCYMHSWLLVGDICTSNDRVCKVPLQTNLKPTHHLLARWQGQVRRCLKTIHAINLFPPKWLPINCFTLTKDGLQTLNITAGGKCRHHLRLPSIVNRVDQKSGITTKYPVPLQGTSANLCYMHSWLLAGDICTSNDRVCKVPLQTNLKPTHHLVGGWQGQVRRCLKTIHAVNLFPAKWLPIICFTLTKDGLQTLNITAGGKCRHHLRLPSIVNRVDRSESKLIGVVVLSNINNRFLCKVLLQTCATCIPGFL